MTDHRLPQDGWIFLARFLPELTSNEAFGHLGTIDMLEGLDRIQTLKPSTNEETANTYSGNFGNRSFPLHTDLAHWAIPPRFVALRCILGAPGVATKLLDGRSLMQLVGIESLRRSLVQPRRPISNRRRLLSLLERANDRSDYILRWDNLFLTPASRHAEQISSMVLDYFSQAQTIDIYLEQPGDTLIIDNWRILHGRSPIPKHGTERRIDRTYLMEAYEYSR
jgi:hypothetical protein